MSRKLHQVITEMDAVRAEILELAEVEEPTEEQSARFAELEASYNALEDERAPLATRAARVEQLRSLALDPANLEAGFAAPQVMRKSDPFENLDAIHISYDDKRSRYDENLVSRAVTAITDYRPRFVDDESVQNAVRMVERVPGVAQHAILCGSPAYRSAFASWMSSQGQNVMYTPEESEAVRAALSLTGANGGFTLPTLFDPTLIHTGTASKNPMRLISRNITGTQNVWHGVSVNNVTTYWTAEATALTDGSPTFSNPSITAAKLTAFISESYEIFEDSEALGALPELIGEAIGYAESDAFVVGSGSGAPRGIVTAISATAASTITATTRGAFTSASAVDVFALLNSVPSRYEDTATWLANKFTFNTIKQMSTGGNGSFFWTNFNSAIGDPLLGSPIGQSSAMASVTTSGTVLMVLGDFSQFVIYDRVGTSVEYVPNLFNASGIPLGQRGLIAHKRVGSDCTDINAFRFLKA